jgi:hypothetical protein
VTSPTIAGILDSLAERCEAASGADRELDADICRASGLSSEQPDGAWITCLPDGYRHSINPTSFTASLDAAMSLVPEGFDWSVSCEQGRGVAVTISSDRGFSPDVSAATPALALTAAALRAISQAVEDD